jgi:hypothetical protein
MEATHVPVEKIEKHWPKFGYAFSATAFTLILKLADKKDIFSEHRLIAVGLGATAVLGVVFARAIEYDGWRSFSLTQQGIIFCLWINRHLQYRPRLDTVLAGDWPGCRFRRHTLYRFCSERKAAP